MFDSIVAFISAIYDDIWLILFSLFVIFLVVRIALPYILLCVGMIALPLIIGLWIAKLGLVITKSFYGFFAKITRITAKYFYITSILLDFGLIMYAKIISMYGLNHDLAKWFSLLLCILAFSIMINILLWSYYFLSKKLSYLFENLSDKLFDFKLWLKYKIFKRIEWKLILLKNKVKCKIKSFIDDIKKKIFKR